MEGPTRTRILRAHRFRLDPSRAETAELLRFVEARRKAYNWGLALVKDVLGLDRCADRLRMLEARGHPYRLLSRNDLINLFGQAKGSLSWTNGVPVKVFEFAFADLSAALARYFRSRASDTGVGFPTFVGAGEREGFTIRGAIRAEHDRIALPGLAAIGVRGSTSRLERELARLDGQIREASVTRRQGRWWISMVVERNVRVEEAVSDHRLGLDVGLHQFVTTSDGEIIANPRFLRRSARRLHQLARAVGRSQAARESAVLLPAIAHHGMRLAEWDASGQTGALPSFPRLALPAKSTRHRRKECRYGAALAKAANQRRTFHGQTAAALTRNVGAIGHESLRIANMLRNHSLAGSIADAGWGRFLSRLDTRAEDRGILVVEAPTFFASSQICSGCGFQNEAVKGLEVRLWRCPACGRLNERDHNAALNLKPTEAQLETARARRAERRADYEARKIKVAARAKAAGAANRRRLAEKKERAGRRALAEPTAVPPVSLNPIRVPAASGTSVGPMPGKTQTSAWRPQKPVLAPARVSEARTDVRRSRMNSASGPP